MISSGTLRADLCFPGSSAGEESACNESGRPEFNPWIGKIPWRRERLPTQVSYPGEFHGLYSPWGRKESEMTERLSLSHADLFGSLWKEQSYCLFKASSLIFDALYFGQMENKTVRGS